jgi:NAD-dependent dihydropyrimidine dehydrogenase PreA subunit
VSSNGVQHGIFIRIDVDEDVGRDSAMAAKLAEACPVDIYAQKTDGTLGIVEQNLDECVLCYLCVDAAPEGTVRVIKLYEEAPGANPAAQGT